MRLEKFYFEPQSLQKKKKNISQYAIQRKGWWVKDDYIQVVDEMITS